MSDNINIITADISNININARSNDINIMIAKRPPQCGEDVRSAFTKKNTKKITDIHYVTIDLPPVQKKKWEDPS